MTNGSSQPQDPLERVCIPWRLHVPFGRLEAEHEADTGKRDFRPSGVGSLSVNGAGAVDAETSSMIMMRSQSSQARAPSP